MAKINDSRKAIGLIAIPVALIVIQNLIKFAAKAKISGVGISLSTLAVGQLFPFVFYENLLLGKFISIKKELKKGKKNHSSLNQKITLVLNDNIEDFDGIRSKLILMLTINVVLFVMSIAFFTTGYDFVSMCIGICACLISWFNLVLS